MEMRGRGDENKVVNDKNDEIVMGGLEVGGKLELTSDGFSFIFANIITEF